MKKIINRKSYDTERAKKVGCYVDYNTLVTRTLYVNNNGEKFIHYLNPSYRYIAETVYDENYAEICNEVLGDAKEMILTITNETMPIWDKWMDKSDMRKEYLEECMANFPKSGGFSIWLEEYKQYV